MTKPCFGDLMETASAKWPPVETADPDAPRAAVRVEGGVGYLVMNRPQKRNALDAAMRSALLAVLDAWRDDDAVRVVVLSGSGKTFAAGADLQELQARSVEEQRTFITPPHIYDVVATYPKPVVACINGHALGAGCELMMACDLRIAGDRAKVGQPEVGLGLIPGGGGTQRLPRLAGYGKAMYLVLTGEIITAERAEAVGLVDEVVPQERLHERTSELAGALAAKSPVALQKAKEAVRAAWELPLAEGLAREIDLFMEAFASEDAKEGIAAFLERRPADFRGR